jgi:hypothetical protein
MHDRGCIISCSDVPVKVGIQQLRKVARCSMQKVSDQSLNDGVSPAAKSLYFSNALLEPSVAKQNPNPGKQLRSSYLGIATAFCFSKAASSESLLVLVQILVEVGADLHQLIYFTAVCCSLKRRCPRRG